MSPACRYSPGSRIPARRPRRLLLLAACAMLVQWGCGAERRPTRHVVEITNFRFEPDTLSVAVGDTIVWVNRDVVPHTATARAAGWDSGALAPQQSWVHVAERAGGTHYICALHPSMAGWIDVR